MKPMFGVFTVAFALTPAVAQSQGGAATIQTAVFSGKSGPVRTLAAKDFKVWVDNQERTVTSAAIPPARKHALVLLFDNTTINAQDQANIRRYASDFITAAASPDLYMKIATFRTGIELLQPYTTDAARLKASLVGTASSAIAHTAGGAVRASTGTNLGGRETGQTSLGNITVGGDQTSRTQAFAESLRGLVESMAPIRGPKAVFLFSGGQSFSADATPQVDAAIEAANRAGVTIYGISDNTSFAKTFADPTGGSTLKVTQYLATALQQAVQELASFYEVMVDLADVESSGRCHALRVRTDLEGADVRAPESFCRAVQKDALAGTAAGRRLDGWLASQAAGSLAAAARAFWRYPGDGPQANVTVAMDAPLSGITFQKTKNKFHGELNVAGAAYGVGGSVAARFSESVALDFTDKKEADAFAKRPYHYENLLQLPAGKYTVKAVISPAGDAWGRAETSVEIPQHDATKLDMSGVVLSRELRPAAATAAGLDPGMIEGSTPLIAGGQQVVPAAQARFKNSEKLYLYAEIYEPSLAGANPAAVSFQYRIVDRASGEVKADSGPPASLASFVRPGNPVIPVATAATIYRLAQGAYRLDVRAVLATGSADVIRSTDFDVIQ